MDVLSLNSKHLSRLAVCCGSECCIEQFSIDTLHWYSAHMCVFTSIHQDERGMPMKDGDVKGDRDPRLTREQEAIRQRGLRILARMIVKAHLDGRLEVKARGNGVGPSVPVEEEAPRGEDPRDR